MTSRLNPMNLGFGGVVPAPSAGARAAWSRAISLRADVKLAPCMARPNLFSGD
jgi:hypothetical protein